MKTSSSRRLNKSRIFSLTCSNYRSQLVSFLTTKQRIDQRLRRLWEQSELNQKLAPDRLLGLLILFWSFDSWTSYWLHILDHYQRSVGEWQRRITRGLRGKVKRNRHVYTRNGCKLPRELADFPAASQISSKFQIKGVWELLVHFCLVRLDQALLDAE